MRIPHRALGFALFVLLGLPALAGAAPNEGVTSGKADAGRFNSNELLPRVQTGDASLPYSRILRETEPPYENLFREVQAGGRMVEKVGPVNALVQGSLFSRARVNFRTEDAELKLGRFYLDLRALSASLLYSDNVDLTEHNRKDGLIGIVRLTSAAKFHIADNIRLEVQGTLVYLPFRGKAGIAGFGIYDPLTAFEPLPVFLTQLTLDEHLGSWNMEVKDEFSVRLRRFGLDAFNNEPFNEEDRAGVYVFSDRSRFRGEEARYDYNEARNVVGASASRLLPTVTQLEFGANRTDYFYYAVRGKEFLPTGRNMVYAALVSQRETLRFKPFARYRAWKYDDSEGWAEEVRSGIQGPITDNLILLADGGYYWRTDSDHATYLAHAGLRHTLNPLTHHDLEFNRGVTEPIEEIEDSITYLLHHTFRANLWGAIYGSIARFEDVHTGGRTGEARRAAIRFNYDLAQRTSLRLSGAYTDSRYDDPTLGNFREWIGRSEIIYRHTASLHLQLHYQYRNRQSDPPGTSFWENLVMLTVIKHF